jgi:hypothetical protein
MGSSLAFLEAKLMGRRQSLAARKAPRIVIEMAGPLVTEIAGIDLRFVPVG